MVDILFVYYILLIGVVSSFLFDSAIEPNVFSLSFWLGKL